MTNPRSASSRRPPRFLPTPRDRRILHAIATHGRLTREQIRRLFFRRVDGALASPQAANARMLTLVSAGLVDVVVLSSGRGSGAYAYGMTRRGAPHHRPSAHDRAPATIWHEIEIAEFRVHLEEELIRADGAIVEWQGERLLRKMLPATNRSPIPDALVHWRLPHSEGAFMLEWDRGTEPLAVLTAKLIRYRSYGRSRRHRALLPGLGLRPRLAIVLHSPERQQRLVRWIEEHGRDLATYTVLLGARSDIFARPLGATWWSGPGSPVSLVE